MQLNKNQSGFDDNASSANRTKAEDAELRLIKSLQKTIWAVSKGSKSKDPTGDKVYEKYELMAKAYMEYCKVQGTCTTTPVSKDKIPAIIEVSNNYDLMVELMDGPLFLAMLGNKLDVDLIPYKNLHHVITKFKERNNYEQSKGVKAAFTAMKKVLTDVIGTNVILIQ